MSINFISGITGNRGVEQNTSVEATPIKPQKTLGGVIIAWLSDRLVDAREQTRLDIGEGPGKELVAGPVNLRKTPNANSHLSGLGEQLLTTCVDGLRGKDGKLPETKVEFRILGSSSLLRSLQGEIILDEHGNLSSVDFELFDESALDATTGELYLDGEKLSSLLKSKTQFTGELFFDGKPQLSGEVVTVVVEGVSKLRFIPTKPEPVVEDSRSIQIKVVE